MFAAGCLDAAARRQNNRNGSRENREPFSQFDHPNLGALSSESLTEESGRRSLGRKATRLGSAAGPLNSSTHSAPQIL